MFQCRIFFFFLEFVTENKEITEKNNKYRTMLFLFIYHKVVSRDLSSLAICLRIFFSLHKAICFASIFIRINRYQFSLLYFFGGKSEIQAVLY